MNDMPDLSICFKEAYLPLQVPAVQGKLLFNIQVRRAWKNFQDKHRNRKGENREIFFRQSENKDFPRSTT